MKNLLTRAVSLLILLLTSRLISGADPVLWQIGKMDHQDTEFALAPGNYDRYAEDGCFIIGQSEPGRDWPYVHPGPADGWAGGRTHTFSIIFGLKEKLGQGTCRLRLELVDTQDKVPPTLSVDVNGQSFTRKLTPGAGAVSLRQPDKGVPSTCTLEFPARLLKTGANEIGITTTSGSWVIYDAVVLEAPIVATLANLQDFTRVLSVSASATQVKRDGKRFQRLTASVLHAGQPVDAAWRVDGKDVAKIKLTAGRQSFDLFVPGVEKARSANVTLIAGTRTIASQTVTLTPGVEQIILVFKTHFDIGYTDMATNVVQRYRTTMIDRALEVVDQNRDLPPDQQFVWTISGWPMHEILDWPDQTIERKHRVEAALKQGRFVVHALPFTTHSELLEPEDLVRGLTFSSRVARELGLELPRDAKMTDVPEHTWMLATLLHHAGVDFMMIGCNGASGPLRVPPLFWWEGPDGSRVLMRYSPDYGTRLEPEAGWPYRTWLAVLHTGDNHGPPQPEEVKRLLARAAQQFPGVKIRIGRMSDFYDAIVREAPALPILRGDAPDTWIHGPLSDPAGARRARHTRPMITETEALNTQLRAWNLPMTDAGPVVAEAYEQSLLYGEHTWGGAIGWIHGPLSFAEEFQKDRAAGRFARIESSWEEHTAYINKAHELIAPVLTENLDTLARSVNISGQRVVVYNPLPWKRSGLVRISGSGLSVNAVKATDNPQITPVERDGSNLRFLARDIPPMGYRTYVPAPAAAIEPARLPESVSQSTIETAFFKATLDPSRGVIASLIDKKSGRELAGNNEKLGLGQYLYERFDGNQVTQYCQAYLKPGHMNGDFYKPGLPSAGQCAYQAASPRDFKLHMAQTPLGATATMHAAATAHLPAITTRLLLYNDQPYADLELTVNDKPLEPWPEAGWLCLPFNVDQPQFRLGRLASIIDPVRDVLPGANRYIFGLDTGLTVTDGRHHGVGLCSPDLPLVSLDTPGCWKYSTNFVPQRPVVFINLFNNQWDTNFRLWNQGTWTTTVRLWSVKTADAEPAMITPSFETRYALSAAVATGSAGPLPLSRRGLALSQKGILATSFGDNPDGPGTILRLWEYAGHSGRCRVQFPEGYSATTVQPIDLRGRPAGKALKVKQGSFEINIHAFAPAAFLLNSR